jgi:hypothetical protein
VALPANEPEAQLAMRIDAHLCHLKRAAARFITLLSKAQDRASRDDPLQAVKMRWDLQILRSLADLAEGGLATSSAATKLITLDGIDKICTSWIEAGFSDEFLRAAKIQDWTRFEMPSDAVN